MIHSNFRDLRNWRYLVAFLALFFAGPAAAEVVMKAINIGHLGHGPTGYTEATAINSHGQVVGNSRTAEGDNRAFSWTAAGGMVNLGTLNGVASTAVAVTENGHVIGYDWYFFGGNWLTRIYSWTPGVGMVWIGSLGGMTNETISAVSSSGQVVGYSCSDSERNMCRAFSWTVDGGMVDLGTLGAAYSYATDVSEDGQVVGYLSPYRAFSWTADGGMVDLGVLPGAPLSFAEAVAAGGGQVVGSSGDLSIFTRRAFSWTSAGGMLDLGHLGAGWSSARFVADDGTVFGTSGLTNGESRAFAWTASGGMTNMGALGGFDSAVLGINKSGLAMGQVTDSSWQYAFAWTPASEMAPLTLGGNSGPRAVGEGGHIVGYSFLNGSGGMRGFIWSESSGVIELPTLPGGNHSDALAVNSKGQAVGVATVPTGEYQFGEVYASRAVLWEPAAAPVAPASIPGQVATEGVSFGYTLPPFSDADGDVLAYEFAGLPVWLSVCYPQTNPRYLCGRPPFTEATAGNPKQYSITVTATDPWGLSASKEFALTVQHANAPPVAPGSIPAQVATEWVSFSFTAPQFTDADGEVLAYVFSGLPSWLKVPYPLINPRYVAGRPPYTEATADNPKQYTVTLTATDPQGASASRSFTLTVNHVNAPPVAPGSIPAQVATEWVSFSYTVPQFTDADGEVLSYEFSGLPGWLKVCYPQTNPRYLCGRPPYTEATAGSPKHYSITVTATDPNGASAGRAFALTVNHVNAPPVAPGSIPAQVATEGVSFGYTVPQFTDADGEVLSYGFSGLPVWLKVCYPATNPRYLCGKPPATEATPGNPKQYSITITATDPHGASASKAFSLSVQDAT